MCSHGYHHNGFMETPALGTEEVRLIMVLWGLLHLGHRKYVYIYNCLS